MISEGADGSVESCRVYLVDDHPMVLEWLTHLIGQQADFSVCGASAQADVAVVAIERLQPDVVILDVNLPGSCGLRLIKEIRRRSPATAVLVFSMYEEELYGERALRAGAVGYVMKRQATRYLMAALRSVARGEHYVSEAFKGRLVEQMVHREGGATDVSRFSDRELEVYRMLGQGYTTRGIAQVLGISIKTVQVHCSRMKRKMAVSSGSQLVRQAILWWESQQQG